MKKMNRKGFTIVELVIVIAVIAILAAVLIPTFSGIVEKAQMSAVQQTGASIWKELYALDLSDGVLDGNEGKNADGTAKAIVPSTGATYTVTAASGNTAASFAFTYTDGTHTASFSGGEWSVAKN